MTSIQGQSRLEENNFCFRFLTDGRWRCWFCYPIFVNNSHCNIREDAESHTAGFLYGYGMFTLWIKTHISLNHNENIPYLLLECLPYGIPHPLYLQQILRVSGRSFSGLCISWYQQKAKSLFSSVNSLVQYWKIKKKPPWFNQSISENHKIDPSIGAVIVSTSCYHTAVFFVLCNGHL